MPEKAAEVPASVVFFLPFVALRNIVRKKIGAEIVLYFQQSCERPCLVKIHRSAIVDLERCGGLLAIHAGCGVLLRQV